MSSNYPLALFWAIIHLGLSLRRWQEFPNGGYESADRQFLVGDLLLITPVLLPNVSTVQGVFPAAGYVQSVSQSIAQFDNEITFTVAHGGTTGRMRR